MSEFPEIDLYTEVDDEMYEELAALVGEKIVHVEIWEESLGDVMAGEEAEEAGQIGFDIDLYLEDGVYFELYSVTSFKTLDGDPLPDCTRVEESIRSLLKENASLGDVAVDENDALVLVLNRGPNPALYLAVGGWVLEEWDELPV